VSSTPKTSDGSVTRRDEAEWFKYRSYDFRQFSDLEALAHRKREFGLTVSAVLPCRNVADTVGGIGDEIHAVNRQPGDHSLDPIHSNRARAERGFAGLRGASRGGHMRGSPLISRTSRSGALAGQGGARRREKE
jgi:hypothetical protein